MPGVRGRRYLVTLAVIAGLVASYAAAGFLLVPRWTRSELVGLSARDLGRTLSIGNVGFNPFTWTLAITDLSLPDADGRPMISFGRLEVTLGIASVRRLAPSLSDVFLESPRVSAVVRRDGTLNLAALRKLMARPANSQAGSPGSKPFRLSVDRLAVANGSATYEDDSRPAPFRIELRPIAFELLGFSTTGSSPGSYHLTASIGRGGRLDWSGTIREAPMSLRGTLELEGLSARTVGTYLGPVLPAEVSRGTVALRGGFAIESDAGAAGRRTRMTIDIQRAQVSGLGVRPQGATPDLVQLNRLTLANARIDPERRTIRVGQITLAGAEVRGWLDQGGKLNLLELLGRPADRSAGSAAPAGGATQGGAPANPAAGASRAAAWRISAPDIRVENTRISLEDRGVKPAAELTLGAVTARITGYDSSPGVPITVSAQAAVNGKGELRLTAGGTLRPEALSAKLSLSRFDLRALQPYLSEYTALTLASGLLSSALDVSQGTDGGFTAAGRIDIADLRAVDDDLRQDFVKWQGVHIVGFRYASNRASLQIRRVVAVAPYARIIIGADHTLNVSEALHPRRARPGAEPAKTVHRTAATAGGRPPARASPSTSMTIGLVRIANGTADYADFSMQPNFATGIQDLHGTIEGLSSEPGSRAAVDLQGRVDRYAPVDISGVVNLLSASTYSDIRMRFRGLELTRMTPYVVRFAGYRVASGTLDADLHYKVDHGRLDANHRLVIDQLQLGEQVRTAHPVKLPLRLAVALLKDRNGVIRIGLPVTGNLNSPQFSLAPLIGKALLAAVEKAVTAPFAMLGRMFGGGPDMNRIDFAPGSAALLPAAQSRLAALAKALAQRPQLQLQVPAAFAPDVDRPALARRKLRDELIALARSGAGVRPGRGGPDRSQQRPRPEAGEEVLELPAEHYRLLRAAYRNALGPKAPLPATAQKVPPFEPAILEMQSTLLERMPVSQADLQALAGRRAQAIRAAILGAGGVDSARVGITPAAPQAATAGKVAVKLGLK